jgi:hypothetical protein
VAAVLALAVVFFAWGRAAGASAAPVPTWTNACATDVDVAACERLNYVAAELSAIDANTTSSGSPTVAGTVALDGDTTARLNLIWWGEWAAVGTLLALIVAPMFTSAFRFLQP